MKTPGWWGRDGGAMAVLFGPVAALYRGLGRFRAVGVRPVKVGVPVICVGNLTAGGAGKTPTALALAALLDRADLRFLTRGYGGRLKGPLRVDPAIHTAADVGDEALLLARAAPTWLARDRVRGARAAVADGAGLIVMDDGFQNPALHKDLSIVVVDAGFGFGNGRLMPAGPLREPVAAGLARADILLLIEDGGEAADNGLPRALPPGLPFFRACFRPATDPAAFDGQPLFAFAGIGRPEKFFLSLQQAGHRLAGTRGFADHHRYRAEELMEIVEISVALGAQPVTTAKDAVRLGPTEREMVRIFEVSLEFADPEDLRRLIETALAAGKRA
ncbi:tetraacyldisaccharide 4'-kinase [Oceanibacterium hippocampi]|uniref:Tetraacyldisaccharide 4'-kinase n=1 Tax=Oceanibacterium hippocampi TaxID=745714 RepID=A0A1Y5SIA2_9PROT|nr:tetraacyldisaccharide 4'-kinase [Oceanibacterium hippocampi]SLN41340.1 Tetraacyldisaccharide 4'-kinase [Oceanibacterium hippocampi]